jgi:hypothetical protein
MSHCGSHPCHWCEAEFPWSHAMRRHDHRGGRRHLRDNHPWRRRGVWGAAEDRGPPPHRTHESVIADAAEAASSALPWQSKTHPRRKSGVDGPCPLAKVPLFNLVWDVCMDFMHIVKVLMSGHLFPLLKGQRSLKAPQVEANEAEDPEVARYRSGVCRWAGHDRS